ncbi:MAG TPA: FixH family protein [Burkholderiales bacterium]|nr:FixH family protein [Burkholderiales bacterium]
MSKPWYREPWPWILMSGPAAAILGGVVTLWLALHSSDGLVAEDYYKQGLAINRVLAKEDEAERRGISAAIRLEPDRLHVDLKGDAPPALFARLAHATRAGYDMRLRLVPVAPGAYEAELGRLPPGRWQVIVEDPRGSWRIARETP